MKRNLTVILFSVTIVAMGTLLFYLLSIPDLMTTSRTSDFSGREATLGKPFDATDVPPGNYSGLVRLSGNRYALVSDKADHGGYFVFDIDIDNEGNITSVTNRGFRKLEEENLDEEATAYDSDHHQLYIGRENTSEIIRYDILNGQQTGQTVVTDYRDKGYSNRTIESLTYDKRYMSVFTINEGPLKGDNGLVLSLLEYTPNLTLKKRYSYILDLPLDDSPTIDDTHAFGVAELLSLGDGTLLVLEREFKVADVKVGSWVMNKIFRITPGHPAKTFVTGWRTFWVLPMRHWPITRACVWDPSCPTGARSSSSVPTAKTDTWVSCAIGSERSSCRAASDGYHEFLRMAVMRPLEWLS